MVSLDLEDGTSQGCLVCQYKSFGTKIRILAWKKTPEPLKNKTGLNLSARRAAELSSDSDLRSSSGGHLGGSLFYIQQDNYHCWWLIVSSTAR